MDPRNGEVEETDPAKRVVAQLLITMTGDGRIAVEGATTSKIQAYGLLECARDAIKDSIDRAAANKVGIVRPTGINLPNLRG